MRVFFADIDGYIVNANIQKYVNQIELFGDEPIKDFEYVKKCIEFMYKEAQNKGDSIEQLAFIERVYKFVSNDIFEMLKEYRDCFLEYDNLITDEEKIEYIEKYKSNPVISSNNEEIPSYMEYIIKSLEYAKSLIELEYIKTRHNGKPLNLPFKTINEDNDIIHYDENEDPLKRSKTALKRMRIYARSRREGADDFLTACRMLGDTQVVNYDEIYTKENLIPGVLEGLKHMLESKQVDMIIACSHHTGPRETLAKIKLFKEELPFVLMLPESLLKFHLEPAQMGKRRGRSSKDNQINIIREKIAQMLGINTSEIECILADDSYDNLKGLSEEKQGILYRKRSSKEIESGIDNQVDERFERQPSWDISVINQVFANIKKKFDSLRNKIFKK